MGVPAGNYLHLLQRSEPGERATFHRIILSLTPSLGPRGRDIREIPNGIATPTRGQRRSRRGLIGTSLYDSRPPRPDPRSGNLIFRTGKYADPIARARKGDVEVCPLARSAADRSGYPGPQYGVGPG